MFHLRGPIRSHHGHPLIKDPHHRQPPAPVSEMERSGVAVIGILCVLFSRVSGEEVEMKVRPGDNARLYCDRSWKTGVRVWYRNSSNEHRPPLIIIEEDLKNGTFPRYSFVWNPSIRTHDLLVKNVSESDLGRYYCGVQERKLSRYKPGRVEDVYYLGYRTTRLSFFGKSFILNVVHSSPTCVPTPGNQFASSYRRNGFPSWVLGSTPAGGQEDVCYASLDLPSRGQKRLKKKERVESSDISTYSEVQTVKEM
ncbi:hypothetical protein NFI96_027239 [Prochilodus magdalenae]|nr:hypothetical protein NFI96_027239 [Prochilodus magdalenae]